jgi:predicted amidohydrolase YtcJ
MKAGLLLLMAGAAMAQQADFVLYGGKIVTVDGKFRVAEAMAVRGDRILAVGTRTEVERAAGAAARKVDLKGKTVLPGLIDSHLHAADSSMYEWDHPVPTMETIADVLKYFRERAAVVKPGEWITLSQVFITRLRDQRFPTRAELDAAAPRNPVVFETGPDAALNTLALKESGIDRNFQITDGKPGRIERGANGEPTGMLRGCTRLVKVRDSGRKPTMADRERQLKALLADYNSVGLTSISERDLPASGVELYRLMKGKGELTCRVFVMHSVDGQASMDKIAASIKAIAADPLHNYDNMLWVRGIKIYEDGGMLTGSAYMLQPWGVSKVYSITDPNYRGMQYITVAKLYQIFKEAIRNGLQPTAHAVGDAAVTAMVDAYEELNRETPVREARPCISHSNFMTAEAIRRMKQIGIVADLQPAWMYLDGATLRTQFGEARTAYFQPYKALFDAGVVAGAGSDHMQKIGSLRSINPYNPWLGMWTMLARQPRWTDQPLHPEQRITREQAIRMYTSNNAFLTFEEREKGSLEKGKLADFIVLDRDVLTCPLEQVKDVQVERTYLGGKAVFDRGR